MQCSAMAVRPPAPPPIARPVVTSHPLPPPPLPPQGAGGLPGSFELECAVASIDTQLGCFAATVFELADGEEARGAKL